MVGCTDAACLAEIGGALGVDRLVASHIGRVGRTYVVNIKIINIRTTEVEQRIYETVSGEIDAVIATLKTAARRLFPAARPTTANKPPPAKPKTAEPPRVAATPTPAPLGAETPTVTEPASGGKTPVVPIALLAVGGVGVITGVIFAVKAKGHESNANDENFIGGQLEIDRAKSANTIGMVALGAGAVIAAVGVILMMMGGDDAPPAEVALLPTLTENAAGLTVAFDF